MKFTPEVSANLYAWTHCTTPPCAEDFEVVVETIGTGAPALDMTGGYRWTIVEMDGPRIMKVRAEPVKPPGP